MFNQKNLEHSFELAFSEVLKSISKYKRVWIHQYLAFPEVYNILASISSNQSVLFTNHGLELNESDFWNRYEPSPNHLFVEVSNFSSQRTKRHVNNVMFEYAGIWRSDLDTLCNQAYSDKSTFFVSVGRILTHKAFDVTIRALRTDQVLKIIGSKNQHSLYQIFLISLSLFKDVIFLGELPEQEKFQVLSQAIALIASSSSQSLSGRPRENSELLGIVVLEAIMAGTLPITSNQSAFKELMEFFDLTDFIYRERDVSDLRRKMEFTLGLDDDCYGEKIQRAQYLLRERFAWDDYWSRIRKRLNDVRTTDTFKED
ncbi:glycosyltransferase [Oscillatoria sp. CS-180]|nr:glycosyltransferase [Oscillatoria sp. CS-180]